MHYRKSDYELSLNNIDRTTRPTGRPKIVLSSAENEQIINKLKSDYDLFFVTGQGYKLYLVVTNQVDLFLTTRSSTFKWDTCAASAIIKTIQHNSSQTGNLLELKKLLNDSPDVLNPSSLAKYELKYNSNDDELINKNGLIAFLDIPLLEQVIGKLKNTIK